MMNEEDYPTPPPILPGRASLGLDQNDDPAAYRAQWELAERELSQRVMTTTDPVERAQLEQDLVELRVALAELADEAPVRKKRSKGLILWAVLSVLVIGGLGAAWWTWGKPFDNTEYQSEIQAGMETVDELIATQKWDEAYAEIDRLRSEGAPKLWSRSARDRVAEARSKVTGQEQGYALGRAQAALEEEDFDEVRVLLVEAETLGAPAEKLAALRASLTTQEQATKSRALVAQVQAALVKKDEEGATAALESLAVLAPDHADLTALRNDLDAARSRWLEEAEEAEKLTGEAVALDDGTYNAQALELLEKALRLHELPEAREAYQRMSAYGRILKVPVDFSTIAEALEASRPRDRIEVAEGEYEVAIKLPAGRNLVGAGIKKTILKRASKDGVVIDSNEEGLPARLANLTVRHEGSVQSEQRFAAVQVSGSQLRLESVRVENAGGHGIAVVSGGTVRLTDCEVTQSGWDGVMVRDEGSVAELSATKLIRNLHHGIDFWKGGAGRLQRCVVSNNGRSGVVALAPAAPVRLVNCRLTGNRELGAYFSAADEPRVHACEVEKNAFGGIVFQNRVTKGVLSETKVSSNQEVGVAVEKGSEVAITDTKISANKGKDLWENAVFPEVVEEEPPLVPVPAP